MPTPTNPPATLPGHPNTLPRARRGLLAFAGGTVYWLGLLMVLFFAVTSLLFTSYLQEDYREVIHFKTDNPFALLGLWAAALALVWAIYLLRPWEKLAPAVWEWIVTGWAVALGLFWVLLVRSGPVADSQIITINANQFLYGNYQELKPSGYFGKYPYQLGYTLYVQVLFALFGANNYLALQVCNLGFLALAYKMLLGIAAKIFPAAKTRFLTALLLAGFLPPVLYATFLYGNLPGLALALAAMNLALAYRKGRKTRTLVAVVLLCAGAVIFKTNSLVFMLAIFLYLLVDFLRTLSLRTMLAAALLVFCSVFALKPVYWYYQAASGQAIAPGIPYTATLAMGLQRAEMGPGWYSRLNEKLYTQAGFDAPKTDALARQQIKRSLANFSRNPGRAVQFFYEKAISQWNEPSFGSFHTSHSPGQHEGELHPLAENIYEGPAGRAVLNYMNAYHFFITAFAAAGLLALRKSRRFHQLLPLLATLGGFGFHLFWEAKSQYVWPYFLLLVPYAAAGAAAILESRPLQALQRKWLPHKP